MAIQTDIKKLFNEARRVIKHPGLDLLIAPHQQKSKPILLIITPAKIGSAVKRNTVRRRIKALFHEEGFLKKGFDTIIIIKKRGIILTYAQLQQIIIPVFQAETAHEL